ncbi:Uncharacterised protein [Mycobacteroides abscessus subsp. abscessus]|nr:Uncharacterised protein [Mycobacteroides abscessus subsp. abscessus]
MAGGLVWFTDNYHLEMAQSSQFNATNSSQWPQLWLSDGGVLVLRNPDGGVLVFPPHMWRQIHTPTWKRAPYPDWMEDELNPSGLSS